MARGIVGWVYGFVTVRQMKDQLRERGQRLQERLADQVIVKSPSSLSMEIDKETKKAGKYCGKKHNDLNR